MGFFATIGRGWEMSKLSMSVIKKDPELMVYVIISGIMSLACMVGMALPQYMEMAWATNPDGSFSSQYLTFTFAGYMILSIITIFWNCAIIANANIRLTGGNPSFGDGLSAALKRLPIIILWGIIAGTVGLLLKFIEGALRSNNNAATQVIGAIFSIVGGLVWWVMTFFMLPHLIIEGKPLGEALKSSKATFTQTWGENITSGMGIGLVATFFGLLLVIATFALTVAIGPVGLLIGAILLGLLIAWANAANQVAVVALYRYATDKKMPSIYQDLGMTVYNFGNATTLP